MNGKKMSKQMKNKFRMWGNVPTSKGEENKGKSKTMPDMEVNPRQVIENHVRGINPITGAVLDRGLYYGENILPYEKDLTYEELRLKRLSLQSKYEALVAESNKTDEQTTVETVQENGDVQETE